MKKKIIISIVSFLILIILVLLGYKIFLLNQFEFTINKETIKDYNYINTIKISNEEKDEKKLIESSYNSIDNIYFSLPTTDFYYVNNNSSIIEIVNVSDDNLVATITIKKSINLYSDMKSNNIKDYEFLTPKKSKIILKKLENNNIDSDYSLYLYALNNMDNLKNNRILTSNKNIVLNYITNNIITSVLPSSNYYKIEGRYKGIVLQKDNYYSALIDDNGTAYKINFTNGCNINYFNEQNVINYLNNIYIVNK